MRILLFMLLFSLSACYPVYILAPNTTGYIVRIEADGPWEGVVDGQVVSGFNASGIPVFPRMGRSVCWSIWKSRPYSGMLRAFMTYRDYHTGSAEHYPRFGDNITLNITGRVQGCYSPL
jgi:hypothetical protein